MAADEEPASGGPSEPIFFESPAELRAWLEANYGTAAELFVGGWKKATGRAGVSWQEIVDEALCVGWIDSIRRGLPDGAWSQRLTPRRKGSKWSAVNVANVERLRGEGRMRPAGEAAFAARTEDRTAVYSYEQRREARLTPEQEASFRAKDAAWEWFQSQPGSVRTAAVWWVASAKRPETRERRFASLVEEAAAGRIPKALMPLRRRPESSTSR